MGRVARPDAGRTRRQTCAPRLQDAALAQRPELGYRCLVAACVRALDRWLTRLFAVGLTHAQPSPNRPFAPEAAQASRQLKMDIHSAPASDCVTCRPAVG